MKTEKAFKDMLASVGHGLAELRVRKGYSSIRGFASKYDLPEIQYWRMEHGKTNLTLKSLAKVLTIHKMSLHEFFCLMNEEVW